MVLFCQMDVTGRTESDPAAEVLAGNILRYVSVWKAQPRRKVLYAGDAAGKKHLQACGLSPGAWTKGALAATGSVLIVGPGGGQRLAGNAKAISKWLDAGGALLALGLDGAEASAFLPFKVETKQQEHIAASFEPLGNNSLLAGVGPADVHNRDPRKLPLVCGGAVVAGHGILAKARSRDVVFCQLVPWQFEYDKQQQQQMNRKRTFRRASYLVTRLAANLGAAGDTPLLARFHNPVKGAKAEQRWLEGLYLDVPEEWDDPYRFFRW
jgi:hypothetical protein